MYTKECRRTQELRHLFMKLQMLSLISIRAAYPTGLPRISWNSFRQCDGFPNCNSMWSSISCGKILASWIWQYMKRLGRWIPVLSSGRQWHRRSSHAVHRSVSKNLFAQASSSKHRLASTKCCSVSSALLVLVVKMSEINSSGFSGLLVIPEGPSLEPQFLFSLLSSSELFIKEYNSFPTCAQFKLQPYKWCKMAKKARGQTPLSTIFLDLDSAKLPPSIAPKTSEILDSSSLWAKNL